MFKTDKVYFKAVQIGEREEIIHGQKVKVKVYGPPKAYIDNKLVTEEDIIYN